MNKITFELTKQDAFDLMNTLKFQCYTYGR